MNTKLSTWYEMSKLLKATKIREAELRRELCEEFIGNTPMVNGRVTVKGHQEHFEFKAVQALTYRVDQAALETLWNNLTDLEKAAIVYKPSLSLTAYKKLPEDCLIHEAVTSTLSMPTLQLEVNDGY